ncbi:PREDICTED: SUMO-activating enzyme subunit 2 [Rhagoletis zephyria]|uniref:SUMO-activating enzyme subunit 2 n=1 Tax=Rhagoletis zephyria TaxID=28612 RepID=UPI000811A16B|nr:PREDICTED: SUMO-activating enzyme subunit 2 [Rhagoletis zephyria]
MAAALNGVFANTLQEKIRKSKILVVGAGGIGCEILKNLVLSGFPDIEIIDLDTIDLSNLNRQFLFHREHVGKSKAQVARESALQFNPDVKIQAYHDSIMATDYGVNFFKKFDIVLNALDNRAARNHVNRMCLHAEVPLIESGTAGYNGQVELIKKGLTQCYECTPKAKQKTFPGCTIRNTPSEPIHCIVWAKHLFNQLFGESVEDEDISPDMADPEGNTAGDGEQEVKMDDNIPENESGNIVRVNTRQWAKEADYDAATLFNKFFYDDIKYLLSMSNLWKERKAPTPLKWDSVLVKKDNAENDISADAPKDTTQHYHKVWSLAECSTVFADCIKKLKTSYLKLNDGEALVWDKDDQPAMDFVAACANIRAYIFEIGRKSRFEIKSMAGNIIPAIATTNAITAGVVVLQAFKVLQGQLEKCKSVYMRLRQNPRQQLLVPEKILTAPNPKCIVCSSEPAVHIRIDTKKMRIKDFRDDVLIKTLNMVNPDVVEPNKGIVVISSEEGETECNEDKLMSELGIVDGVILKCDDFFQNYELDVVVIHFDAERDESLFEVASESNQIKAKEIEPILAESNGNKKAESTGEEEAEDGPSTSKKSRITEVVEDDDDLCLIEDDDECNAEDKVVAATDKKSRVAEEFENDEDLSLIEDDDVCTVEDKVVAATDKLTVTSPVKGATVPKLSNKRKPSPLTDDEVTEIKDSDDEEIDGPTKSKRFRSSPPKDLNTSEVINID